MRRKWELRSTRGKFLSIINNSYFQGSLKKYGICPILTEDELYSKVEQYILRIKNKPTKKQYYSFPVIFYMLDSDDRRERAFSNLLSIMPKCSILDSLVQLFGKEEADIRFVEYRKNLSEGILNIPKEKIKDRSVFRGSHWIKRGYTEEEAKKIISDIQRKNSSKRDKSNYKNRENYQVCEEYWISRGYSEEDVKKNVKDAIEKCSNNKEGMIKRHGEEKGTYLFNKRIEKYTKSMEGKRSGYTSKESKRFFIPLYKKLRRLGYNKEDIKWGIKGSKEWFLTRDVGNKVYFYDFTIPSKKLIIEYNGIGWHPMAPFKIDDPEFRYIGDCFGGTHETAYYGFIDKIKVTQKHGFTLLSFWSNETDVQNKMMESVFKLLEE